MRKLASLLFMVCAMASSARADLPQFCCSTSLDASERLLLIPADGVPMGTFTVTVKNDACVPIPNAIVECIILGIADSRVRLCPSAVLTRTTDANGVAVFNIPGGGCYKGTNALSIRANGIEIREFRAVVSPDYAEIDNVGQPGKSDLRVGIVDLVAFARAFALGASSCHDYDNNGSTGITDFAMFGQVYGRFCQ
jgi:hypothetical protein